MGSISQESIKKVFSKIIDDVNSYWKVYEHMKLRSLALQEGIVEISNEEQFWKAVLGKNFADISNQPEQNLKNGQIVKLNNFFISEWTPKVAGRAWTLEGYKDIIEGNNSKYNTIRLDDKLYDVLDPFGKEKVLSAGYGSIRINPSNCSNDNFMYLSAVTERNWHCDLGIPLIVSKSVYEEISRHSQRQGAAWAECITGNLFIGYDLPFKQSVLPRAIGAELVKELESRLINSLYLPKCYIYVSSPLDIKVRHNDSHPVCTAWTLFETEDTRQPLKYTYASFRPDEDESLEKAISFLLYYINEFNGTKIITDFDGVISRLDSKVNLNRNPMQQKTDIDELKRIVWKVKEWRKATIESNY